ncbi:Slc38a7 [Symbiodinium natans]|uniref:Slc38a7 protein n=1 Tax=Symbiodinium natans TaxID=878477 RepID=A0A812JCR1_9DINO|nr:Slc38a7 [Symbiodinium natans]
MAWRLRRARSGTLFLVALVVAALLQVRHQAAAGANNVFVLPPQILKESVSPMSADSSTAASTANLAKNIVGAGVLSLPSGAAKVLDAASSSGVGTHDTNVSVLLLLYVIFGALNAYGFYLIGEVCERTGSRTYQEAWTKALGRQFAWMPSAASVICSFTGMVACVSVIGDTASQLLMSMGQDMVPKEMLLGGISSCVLLPLCLLPSLSPLAFASVLGLLGVSILALMMLLRWFDGSYELGGSFYSDAKTTLDLLTKTQAPSQPNDNLLFQQICIFAAILSNAFSAHFNAPTIFNELEPQPDARGRTSRLPQLATVTTTAFALSGLIFWVITMAGFETFGAHAGASILNSYSAADPLVAVARVGLGLCVLFEFPLLERCFRKTAVEVLGLPKWVEEHALAAVASVGLSVALASFPGFGLDKTSALGGALGVPRNAEGADSEAYLQALRHGPAWPSES